MPPTHATIEHPLPDALEGWLQSSVSQFLDHLRQLDHADLADTIPLDHLRRLFVASDFARDEAFRDAPAIAALLLRPEVVPVWQSIDSEDGQAFAIRLRKFRRLSSVALILRDLVGIDTVADTLAAASRLAELCIQLALHQVEVQLHGRYGTPRSENGEAQQLVVIAMGKLGGSELNFSSDVDLILAFSEGGQCDGARATDNEEFFTRMGQSLAQLLGDVSAEGFVLRVDYRLRPYGNSGRVALSFNAMEHYYQREGREWERYAWIKARPVAGDLLAGRRLIEMLRPFVFRRYLDFTAIEALRDLKARIDHEVDRKELADNLKLGPGGIRELEFAVQLAQLIRGGREVSLRVTGFEQALDALHVCGQFDSLTTDRTRALYRFLRHVENRAQMFADEQTHVLPASADDQARLAWAMGYADTEAMHQRIAEIRAEVQALFARTLDAPERGRRVRAGDSPDAAPILDLPEFSPEVGSAVAQLLGCLPVRRLDARSRERFERALPLLILAAAETEAPDRAALRLTQLMHAIAGRPSYLSLLIERASARSRVAAVFARSAFLAERVIAHPLLLDDLLDRRIEAEALALEDIESIFDRNLARALDGDVEAELVALHEARQSAVFRTALAWANRRISATDTAALLAAIAERCVRHVLALAQRDLTLQYGAFPDCLLILAYGSFGGSELGFGSDLDLVFVFDPAVEGLSTQGPRVIESGRYVVRLSQRILHWLNTPTLAGPLYEIDVRLRPDGAKGSLVLAMTAFRDYQLSRAWIWEHQALVRARAVAGPAALVDDFFEVRSEVLLRVRDPQIVRQQVMDMRARWRRELDRSNAERFDLKQGRGGLVDIEFFLQGLVLIHAHAHAKLLRPIQTTSLIAVLQECSALDMSSAAALIEAHDYWLQLSLDCALDGMSRVVNRDDVVSEKARAVCAVIAAAGFDETSLTNS